MKEATGELNMTVVTVVAIAAIGAFFYFFIWPGIEMGLARNTCQNICPGGRLSEENPVDPDEQVCNCLDSDGNILEISFADEDEE